MEDPIEIEPHERGQPMESESDEDEDFDEEEDFDDDEEDDDAEEDDDEEEGVEYIGVDPFLRNPRLAELLSAVEPHERGQPMESESEEDDDDEELYYVDDPFPLNPRRARLFRAARGQPMGSDSEEGEDFDDEQGPMLQHHMSLLRAGFFHDDEDYASEEDSVVSVDALQEELIWNTQVELEPSTTGMEKKAGRLKPGAAEQHFSTEIDAFMAFLPLPFWETIVHETNQYAMEQMEAYGMQYIRGEWWKGPVTIPEIMAFFGMLLKMVLCPTPGRSYPSAWHLYERSLGTTCMPLRRFLQISSVLHFRKFVDTTRTVDDDLYQIRPLLNIVKATLGAYMDPASEVTLDQARFPGTSKYSEDPQEPFHFRMYLLCCASTSACLRLRVHTADESDIGDATSTQDRAPAEDAQAFPRRGNSDAGKENDPADHVGTEETTEVQTPILRTMDKLVLDMCKPLLREGGYTVNMSNLDPSATAVLHLKNRGVLIRGSLRNHKRLLPDSVFATAAEGRTAMGGSHRFAVNEQHGIVAMRYMGESPSYMITTADGTGITTLEGRGDRESLTGQVPTVMEKFNDAIEGAQRRDRIRYTFSLSHRHEFNKKYYVKLMLCLVDVAMTNASIHYFEAHPEKKENKEHQADFVDALADSLLDGTINWQERYKLSNH